jgi:hypothetical protein
MEVVVCIECPSPSSRNNKARISQLLLSDNKNLNGNNNYKYRWNPIVGISIEQVIRAASNIEWIEDMTEWENDEEVGVWA